MSEEEKILARAGEILTKAESALEGPIRHIADLLLENSQLLQVMSDELLADRQINHRKIEDAVRLIEKAAKEMATVAVRFNDVAKAAENAAKNSYDAYTASEALRGQLEQPLRDAANAAAAANKAATQGAEAAEKGAKAAAAGAEHAKAVRLHVKDMTGRFQTWRNEQLEKRGKPIKNEKLEKWWIFVKAFNDFSPLTRILLTILVSLFIISGIVKMIEAAK